VADILCLLDEPQIIGLCVSKFASICSSWHLFLPWKQESVEKLQNIFYIV